MFETWIMNLTTEEWSYCQNQASDYRYMLESFYQLMEDCRLPMMFLLI